MTYKGHTLVTTVTFRPQTVTIVILLTYVCSNTKITVLALVLSKYQHFITKVTVWCQKVTVVTNVCSLKVTVWAACINWNFGVFCPYPWSLYEYMSTSVFHHIQIWTPSCMYLKKASKTNNKEMSCLVLHQKLRTPSSI